MDLRLDGQADAPAAARRGRPPLAAGRHRGRRRGREPPAPGLPPGPRRHPSLRRDAPRARGGRPRAGDHAARSAPARGTVPVAVSGDLPARVEKDALRVQVRGGRYSVSVEARVEGRPKAIGLPKEPPKDPWPPREVWVFAADETQRQVELSGPTPIDPSRTELPEEWRALPAFLVEPGASLALKEVRRGEAEPPPDALTLARELWLDPDGRGASVRDRFGGTLRATTRLDLLPPGDARPHRRRRPGPARDRPPRDEGGRRRAARARPCSSRPTRASPSAGRSPPSAGRPASSSSRPPSTSRPAGASSAPRGVDRLPGTWTSRWTLLGFFFVLIVTLAVHRLFGLRPAVLALAALVLTHGEPGAPFAVWLSLVAAIALQRVAPAGWIPRLARLWFLASAVVLVVLVVPFARDQVRDALFPQVAEVAAGRGGRLATAPAKAGVPGRRGRRRRGRRPQNVPAAAPPSRSRRTSSTKPRPSSRARRRRCRPSPSRRSRSAAATPTTSPSSRTRRPSCRPDPASRAGPGAATPSRGADPWAATTRCGSSSLSPGMNRLLTLLRLALLAAFGFVLLTGRWPTLPRRPRPEPLAALLSFLCSP